MNTPTILVLGAVASLAGGGMAGAAVPAFAGAPEVDPTAAFTIPVGRIGDEVGYTVNCWNHAEPDGTPIEDAYVGSYGLGLRVDGIETAHTRDGRPQEAVKVTVGANLTQDPADVWSTEDPWTYWAEKPRWFDPLDRSVVQTGYEDWFSWPGNESSGHMFGPFDESPYHHHVFIPLGEGWGSEPCGGYPTGLADSMLPFLVQGQTYVPGQARTAEDASLLTGLAQDWSLDAFSYRQLWPRNIDHQSHVGPPATFNDILVYPIVRETRVEYDYLVAADGRSIEAAETGAWTEVHRSVVWMSPERAWPVLLEYDMQRTGMPTAPAKDFQDVGAWLDYYARLNPIQNLSTVAVMTHYAPGGEAIPWGSDLGRGQAAVAIERAPPGTFRPTDGAGQNLEYPLDEALADVEADATLVDFQAWRNEHPQHALVGAKLAGGQYAQSVYTPVIAPHKPVTTGPTWQFVFADMAAPAGAEAGYIVTAEQPDGSGLATNHDWGSIEFSEASRPLDEHRIAAPVTIDYAFDALRAAYGTSIEPGLQARVLWGLYGFFEAYIDHDATIRSLGPSAVYASESMTRLRVGYGSEDVALDASNASLVEDSRAISFWVDAATGEWVSLWVYDERWPFGPWVNPQPVLGKGDLGADGQVQAKPVAPEAFDRPATIAATAGSLFGAFLLVYFFPAIKFALGRLPPLVPGYAKLRRSKLFDNEFRKGLLEHIEQEPGITPPQLHRAVGGGWSTVVYHLRVLQTNGLVSSMLQGRHRHFFPTGTIDWGRRGQVAVLHNRTTQKLFDHIRKEPGIRQVALTKASGLSGASIRWHLDRLQKVGLVDRTDEGLRAGYVASSEVRRNP